MSLPSPAILTSVQQAVHEGRAQDVSALLAGQPHWEVPTLEWAVEQQDAPLFQALWDVGHQAVGSDAFINLMRQASSTKDHGVFLFLLPRSTPLRNTLALKYAAQEGQIEVVKTLLHHCSFGTFEASHLNAMMVASVHKHWRILDLLLDYNEAPIDLLRYVVQHTACDHEVLHELIQYYHDGDVAFVMTQERMEATNGSLSRGGQILHDVIAARDHKRALEDALWEQEAAGPKSRKM